MDINPFPWLPHRERFQWFLSLSKHSALHTVCVSLLRKICFQMTGKRIGKLVIKFWWAKLGILLIESNPTYLVLLEFGYGKWYYESIPWSRYEGWQKLSTVTLLSTSVPLGAYVLVIWWSTQEWSAAFWNSWSIHHPQIWLYGRRLSTCNKTF